MIRAQSNPKKRDFNGRVTEVLGRRLEHGYFAWCGEGLVATANAQIFLELARASKSDVRPLSENRGYMLRLLSGSDSVPDYRVELVGERGPANYEAMIKKAGQSSKI